MRKTQHMGRFVGYMLDGTVNGITKFDMFVELENTIEGLMHVTSLTNGYYHYNEMAESLTGEHTVKVYKTGQKVRMKCSGADRFKREVDFEVVKKEKQQYRKAFR